VLGGAGGLGDAGALWAGLGAVGFLGGLLVGHRAWRPAAIGIVVAIALVSASGVLR
jgi:hypothetical protein